jgi:hypothetical protein
MTYREVRQWAERIVALYASRTRMTLVEQGELERDLTARLKAALDLGQSLVDCVEVVNSAIDEWELTHSQGGTRIGGFSETGKQVFEKRRL